MKIILSRKGFDSSCGGVASPIFKDGTMLSMPIPSSEIDGVKYVDIMWNGKTYDEIWKSLGGSKYKHDSFCHLDPDIRKGVRKNDLKDWQAAFGQCDQSLSHLENEGVKVGDIFMFFGRFRMAEINRISYLECTRDFQAIYGFLQIGRIAKGNELKKYYWHPHSKGYKGNNAIFVASEKLVIDGKETDTPGYGVFKYSDELRLTRENESHLTYWNKLPWMDNSEITMSYHRNRIYDDELGYFKAVARGQEFVIDENEEVTRWAVKLIKENLEDA